MTPKQNIDELRKFYPFVEKNTVMGMGKSGKFYSADLDGLESYILTKSGTVLIVDGDREIIVQSEIHRLANARRFSNLCDLKMIKHKISITIN